MIVTTGNMYKTVIGLVENSIYTEYVIRTITTNEMEVIFAFFQSRWLIKTITVAPKEIENHKVPTIEWIEARLIIMPIKKAVIKAIEVMTIKRSLCGFIKSVKLILLFCLVFFNGYNPRLNHLQKLTYQWIIYLRLIKCNKIGDCCT